MPTVIDELVVKLGLDPKDFVSGQKKATDALRKTKEAAKEGSKEVSEGAGDMLKAFGGLQGKLLGIAALFTGGLGMTEFSRKMSAVTTQVTYLAKQVGVSAQELEALDAAGAKVGANAGEISGSIAGVYRQLKSGELHGVSRLQSYFQSMTSRKYPTGIPLKNPDGSDRSPSDLFADVARWGSGQHDKAMVSQLWSEMGLAPGAINLLLQGPDVFRAQVEKGKQAALSDADRKKFEDLNSSFHQLAVDADRLGRAIALDLLPGVKQFIEFIDEIVTKIKPASPEQVQTFTDKHLPEMVGGPKSIFGRIKNWWNGSNATGQSSAAPPPAANNVAPTAGGNDSAPAGARARAIAAKGYFKDQLRREGVPEANLDAAASMLAGQAIAESNLNPHLSHDGRTGYGIYGARLDRRARMLAWLKANGYAANSLEGQARYMAREAMNDPTYRASRNALMTATSATMAHGTRVLTNNFERPLIDNSGARYAASRGVFGLEAASNIQLQDVWARGASDITRQHPGLMALQGAGNVSHNNTTSSTSINNLIVNTPTNDPFAHAADVRAALERNETMNQANQGPN